ncbi:ParA family protein [Spirosoma arcticum]
MSTPTTQPAPAAATTGPPVVIAFATQKGGMGKTTLTVLVASWLHYKRRIPVAVLDVDSQLSFYNLRFRETEQMDEETRVRFNAQNMDPYLVVKGEPASVPRLLTKLPPDVRLVFVDMPGNIDVEGYEAALGSVDYLIAPMETSEFSVTTGFSYLKAIRQIDLLPPERCLIVWNKYKEARDGALVDQLEARFKKHGFESLKSRIPQRDSYQDSANRSTMFVVPPTYLRHSGLKDLFVEIESLLPVPTSKPNEESNQ